MNAEVKNRGLTEQPKVTIAIPTYNRAVFLTEALNSALGQTYTNLEVIVSDNASTDDTLQRLKDYHDDRLIVIRQETNLGMIGNLNACVMKASGEFFILLSDDDFLEPTAIQEMVEVFQYGKTGVDRSKIGMVYCKSRIVDTVGAIIGYGRRGPELESAASIITHFFRRKRSIFPGGVMIRTLDLQSLGGYDTSKNFSLIADEKAWISIVMKRGIAAYIDKELTNYRIHTSNVSSSANIGEWITNNNNLAAMCIGEFLNEGDYRSAKAMKRLIHSFNANAISSMILQSFDGTKNKTNSVKQYIFYSKYLFSPCGFFLLFKGVTIIYMPKVVTTKIKKLLLVVQAKS